MLFSYGQSIGVPESFKGVHSSGILPLKDFGDSLEIALVRQDLVPDFDLLDWEDSVRSHYWSPRRHAPAVVHRRPDVLLVLRPPFRDLLHVDGHRHPVAGDGAQLAPRALLEVEDVPPLEPRKTDPLLRVVLVAGPLEVELLLRVPQRHPGVEKVPYACPGGDEHPLDVPQRPHLVDHPQRDYHHGEEDVGEGEGEELDPPGPKEHVYPQAGHY